jgi:hypothetical protein
MIGRTVSFPQQAGQTREQAARAASDKIAAALFDSAGKTHAPAFTTINTESSLHARAAQLARAEAARENDYFIKCDQPANEHIARDEALHGDTLFGMSKLQCTRGNSPPDDLSPKSRVMSPRAKPVQGVHKHSDGSVSITLIHDQAPRNLWVRVYRDRASFLSGRSYATNWERRGCQLWRPRPDLRDIVERNEEIYTKTYSDGHITFKTYRTAEDFEQDRWYSMRQWPEPREQCYNADFDGDEIKHAHPRGRAPAAADQ